MKNSKFIIIAVLCLLGVILILEVVARMSYHTLEHATLPLEEEQKILDALALVDEFTLLDNFVPKASYSNLTHNGIAYQQSILADDSRYTGENNSNKTIEIYGCSYCYGIGLNDSQTLGFKLQSKVEEFKVKNYCIISAGIPVILDNFARRINDSTQLVIINYCNFHQEREAASRWFSKIIARSNTENVYNALREKMLVPVIDNNEIVYYPLKKSEFILEKHSALVNLVDDFFIWKKRYKDKSEEIGQVLLNMQKIAEANGIQFVVNNGDGHQYTKKHLEHFKKIGVNVLDLNIDIGSPEYNLIKDSHPNEKANTEMAEGIEEYIREEI
jgi:hypothetical protein